MSNLKELFNVMPVSSNHTKIAWFQSSAAK